MESAITGTTMPVLTITLAQGERIIAEGGDVAWLSAGFDLETSTTHGTGGKGGFMSGLKRVLGGAQLFLTQYTAGAGGGHIAFTAELPGTIKELPIDAAHTFMILAGAYIASTSDVEISVAFQKKLGAGIFGGAGVVFQEISGSGTAWVQLAGELVERELGPGESLLVHPGHLAMYTAGTSMEFASISGVKNKIFGDSMFLARLTGPGHVWLQSMTPAKLASAIQPYLPHDSNSSN